MFPRTDVLALKKIPGNPVCNVRLELPEDEPLIYLKRIRYADDEKVVYLETFIPYRQYAQLMQADFTAESLYESLESLYSVRVNRAHREIEAVTLNQDEAKLLDIPIHKAVCLVTSVAYAENSDTPVEYSIARYRGDRTKFAVEALR
jgi:GntR family transcriptional regulator